MLKFGRLRVIWASPYFTAVTGICTIVGFLLAIYFYRISIRERELVYCVPPARTVVVDPSTTSALRVTFRERIVTSKVSGLQVVIWNAGRETIRESNVLETIRIVTVPRTPILEAQIRRSTRSVTGMSLDMTNAFRGEVTLRFNIVSVYRRRPRMGVI